MNEIIFPLRANMMRGTVADLHAALKLLKYDVDKDEIDEKRYGKITAAAVRQFQTDNGLTVIGKVDEDTARALNQKLLVAGRLNNDGYTISGQIRSRSTNDPVPGLLVRAVDVDRSGENPLGQPQYSSEDGRYTITYDEREFRVRRPVSGNADVVVRVYDPANPRQALLETKVDGNVPQHVTIDFAVDFVADERPQTGDDDEFVVAGIVRSAEGRPQPDLRISVFDVRLRQEHPLGQDTTDQDGRYEVSYTRKQFRHTAKANADLRARAFDSADQEIASSAVVYKAGAKEKINLTVDNATYRGPAESDRLMKALEPRLRGMRLTELREDDDHQDVTFLSKNSGKDPRRIAYLVAAHRLAAHTEIDPEIFYGFFRNDLPVSLPALLIQEPVVLRRALALAVSDNIIPARFAGEIDNVLDRFKELVVREAVHPRDPNGKKGPLVTLLGTVLPDSGQQETFLRHYVAHDGPIQTFWDDMRATPELRAKVDQLEFAIQAAALSGNHLPLVEELQRLQQGGEIATTRDLVDLDETGWREVLERRPDNGQDIIGAPPYIPGEGEKKLEVYAKGLTRLIERTYPTAFVAARLQDDDLEGKANLLTFFRDNQSSFDITGARLAGYLHDHPEAMANIPAADRPAVQQQLQAMQRLYRVAPQYKATSNLLKDGIDSAFAITRMGPKLFTLKYGQDAALGDAVTARRVYDRAEKIEAVALAIMSNHGLNSARLSTHAVTDEPLDQIDGIPDWQTIFGSLELCECEQCRSVYSPAAYLVDILHFLSDRRLIDPQSIERDEFGRINPSKVKFQKRPGDPTKDLTAKDVLFQRRADLGEIQLTCENTNTLLPYVDLVNEILENYVAPFTPFTLDPTLVSDLDDRTVSDELLAAFTSPELSSPTIQVQKVGECWRLHDQAYTYTIRKDDSDLVRVTSRSRQTSGSPQELAANSQHLNPDAYKALRGCVYPLTLPFDLWSAEGRAYLEHLGVQRHQVMETFLPGDRATRLSNAAVGRERLGLTTTETNLISGATTSQPGASNPGIWNLWGFTKAMLDTTSAIPDPANNNAWIDSGNWLDVLTNRVDVFLQQSGLQYKELLALLGTYYINPAVGGDNRLITIQAGEGQPEDTCETQHLRIIGMGDAALRALRFIRLWRKLGWTMVDLDRALTALGVAYSDPIDETVLTQLSHIQRLQTLLDQPLEKVLSFWGDLDTAHYIDHEAGGQIFHLTLYERLFRNKRVLNPPDPAFSTDPALALAHEAAVTAALGISASDLALLRADADVVPDDMLSLLNLSRLYRHATLAKALKLPVRDYLVALKLYGNPFAHTAATVAFVEQVNAVHDGGLTLVELDYLSRNVIVESARVAPLDEEIGRVLADIRSELQRVAAENTFVEDIDAPGGPTVDLEGDLTSQKLALLGWDSSIIDEAVATLGGAITYRAALPPGVSLPANMPRIVYDAAASQLQSTGAMSEDECGNLLALSPDDAYQKAVTELFDAPRRFVQRHMRRYTIERFSTALTTLPSITFPAALKERIYHDPEAGQLYFIGVMSEDECGNLWALSTDAAYQSAIEALYNAPDAAPTTDIFLTSDGKGSDTTALFDTPTTAAERFAYVLRKLLPQLRDTLSEHVVIQVLAQALNLEMQTVSDLLSQWLDWPGHAGQKLLAAFLEPAYSQSHADVPITRHAFSDQFDAYLRLHKIALLVKRFACTPRQVGWLFTYASASSWPDLGTLPVDEQTAPAAQLGEWQSLAELFTLRDRLPRGEEMLDELLQGAARVDNTAPAADKDAAKAAYLAALTRWTAWPASDLVTLLGQTDSHINTGLLNVTFPEAYAGSGLLTRLHACFGMLTQLGMSAAQCRVLVTADLSQATAEMIKQTVRAKYDEAQWLDLAQPLRDVLREQQRSALVTYLLANPDDQHRWRDSNDIYSYFLIDVEMDPCMMTSRLKQALSSVQLFVQRCLMSLEPQVLASAEVDVKWREWHAMKHYRVWEANRKVFLYPENWIEPELRDDKTPFFQELESELLQNNLTHETAETAFRGYLKKLDAVARLEIVGLYQEQEEDLTGKTVVNVLHVFGRTPGIPHIYYYRRRINDEYWTAWERVDLDIEGEHLIPVVWRRRLYLIWPIFTDEADESWEPTVSIGDNNIGLGAGPRKRWKIQLAWSDYKDKKWLPKRTSAEALKQGLQDDYFEKDQFVFRAGCNEEQLAVRCYSGESTPFYTGMFRLSGHNSDFVPYPAMQDAIPVSMFLPSVFQPKNMMLIEKRDDSNQLYLPKQTVMDVAVALKKGAYHSGIVLAHQVSDFDGLVKLPWFFNDQARTYFVEPWQRFVKPPQEAWYSGDDWSNGGNIGEIDLEQQITLGPDVPLEPIPNMLDPVINPAINPGDPLLFEEAYPVTVMLTNRTLGDGIIGTEMTEPEILDGGGSGVPSMLPGSGAGLFISPTMYAKAAPGSGAERSPAEEILDAADVSDSIKLKGHNEYRYTFTTFYHPYVGKLIEALNLNGVDGLLQRPMQLDSDEASNVFDDTYDPKTGPKRLVAENYPVEDIDFLLGGAYSQYNWELFFHSPLLIANSLRQNQRFADAQRWFHYIFDPTDTSSLDSPQRYWRTKPFYQKARQDYQRQHLVHLMRLLASGGDLDALTGVDDFSKKALRNDYEELVKAVNAWRADPFKPHLVARMRTTAYQKMVVMKYIDNLIAWGDQLFRRDTIESINEATQLYILAADILGKRPDEIPERAVPEVHTYDTLEPSLGDLSNALVQIEEFVPPSAPVGSQGTRRGALPSLPTMLYFCVPKNDNLLAYWDTVADRLFKIRNCMSIEGVVRQLPLFAPPIDPALLGKAAAAGIDIASVLNEVSAPLPHYRFNVLAQKATELCGELKSLSGGLLAALEKRDAEKLALLRAEHETALLKLVEQVREQQMGEADQQLIALRASREITATRYLHYQKLLGVQDVEIPPEKDPISEYTASPNASTRNKDGVKMIEQEVIDLEKMRSAHDWQNSASGAETASIIGHNIPNINISPYGMGTTLGGSNVGSALSALASYYRSIANEDSYQSNRASRMSQHIMREHDWVLQSNSAAKEIMHIDQQIIAAELRQAIAEQELENHRRQIEQAQKIEETMRDKYTNQELYNWMIGQISTVYFQAYQLAYDVAKRAERAFRHELGLINSNFIQFGYWDSLKKGLLAGDRLHHDLKRMEVAYLEQNKREFEISKHVSLVQLDPVALAQLKQTGACFVTVPEAIFDLDNPGHYMRRIKSVGVTIPCVSGPYSSVNCTLTLVRSSTRHSNALLGDKYLRDLQNSDPRFTDNVGTIQSIVTSSGQNDSGLFETNLHDERFLPFEGAGAISTWRIELPDEFRQFDYDTISDVVLHMRYTARPAGEPLKVQAIKEMQDAVNAVATAGEEQGLARLFSVRHEFSGEWHRFLHPASTMDDQTLTVPLNEERFPFLFQGKTITINKIELLIKVKPDFAATHNESTLNFTLAAGDSAPDAGNHQPDDILTLTPWNGLLQGKKSAADQPGNWTINAWLNTGDRLIENALEDVVIVCHYTIV